MNIADHWRILLRLFLNVWRLERFFFLTWLDSGSSHLTKAHTVNLYNIKMPSKFFICIWVSDFQTFYLKFGQRIPLQLRRGFPHVKSPHILLVITGFRWHKSTCPWLCFWHRLTGEKKQTEQTYTHTNKQTNEAIPKKQKQNKTNKNKNRVETHPSDHVLRDWESFRPLRPQLVPGDI